MTLYECRKRARKLKLQVIKLRKSRLGYRYRVSNLYCKNVPELSKAITKLERAKRKEELVSKLNGHRLKRGYKTVERRKRKKGKKRKKRYTPTETEKRRFARRIEKAGNDTIHRVMKKGGIKTTSALRDYGSPNELPLCVRRKRGLPFDEMADELNMSDKRLWDELTYRR